MFGTLVPMGSVLPVPVRFRRAISAIKALEQGQRYEAAFIFGSVAEGTSTAKSDLDAKVIVDIDNPCKQVNHPRIDELKLDLTFLSMPQMRAFAADELSKGFREPNLARGLIVFDKTGDLTALKNSFEGVSAPRYQKVDHQWLQFMLYHATNKVERDLEEDPASALYSMHANIGEVLKIHYRLHARWWVSSKKILPDLRIWDAHLATSLENFLWAREPQEKRRAWQKIVEHVASPMGGIQPISENNCDCEICVVDLSTLES